MRKRSHNSTNSDRSLEAVTPHNSKQLITFNYGHNLDPFIAPPPPIKPHSGRNKKIAALAQPHPKTRRSRDKERTISPYSHLRVVRKNRGKLTSKSQQVFTNKILLLEYEGEEETKPETIRAVTEQR